MSSGEKAPLSGNVIVNTLSNTTHPHNKGVKHFQVLDIHLKKVRPLTGCMRRVEAVIQARGSYTCYGYIITGRHVGEVTVIFSNCLGHPYRSHIPIFSNNNHNEMSTNYEYHFLK